MPFRLVATFAVAVLSVPWTLHPSLPDIALWAWQRPEHLAFIDTDRSSIAVLAETIDLIHPVRYEPRMQPVAAPNDATFIAVVRIQGPGFADPHTIASRIARLAENPHTKAIQIDFDATVSQRDFYRALLTDLRSKVPKSMPLSITALVSWCQADDWISDLPIDEAVPMYFRMGVDAANIRRDHMDVSALHEPLCRSSVGVSLDEPWPRFGTNIRVYAFAPAAWTEPDYRRLLERLAR